MPDPFAWIDDEAATRAERGLTRSLVPFAGSSPEQLDAGGRSFVAFAANDYLGLAGDPRVAEAACDAARRYGWGGAASPLVAGWRTPHHELAEALAAFEQTEAVALFPTGFAANQGAIAALVGPEDAVYLDRLNHACLIAGARVSRATIRVYPHSDADRLEDLLKRDAGRFRRTLIATDSVFSMDGDLAPLRDVVDLADRFGAMLLVDEAHGTGVFGPAGRGAAAELGVAERVPVRVGTLSKALGSIGGFVAGSRRLVDRLINHAPTLIYSTSLPPAAAAAALTSLEILQAEPWRREKVRGLATELRSALRAAGLTVGGADASPIVPLIIGPADMTLAASESLRGHGLLVPAIRPPTVPAGTSRLRISLSAAHETRHIERLTRLLIETARASHWPALANDSGLTDPVQSADDP